MITAEELNGTLVLIRPEKIGVICSDLLEHNQVMVNLGENEVGSFSVHELFVLRNPEEIEKDALNDQTRLPYWDFNDIMEAALFAKSPRTELLREAIVLSRKDPNVFEYTMTSLAEELGLNRSFNISR